MTRARSLSKLSNPSTFTVDTDNNVGVNSTSPVEKLNIVGVVSATSFFGDGTGLTGVASTDNIITGTAATFTGGVTISGASNINVTGVVTATSFVGSGADLTGVSGFATALSTDQTSPLNVFFKTPQQVNIGAGTSVTVESDATSGNIAFIRESIVHVAVGATFHIKTSNTLVTNVLGLF